MARPDVLLEYSYLGRPAWQLTQSKSGPQAPGRAVYKKRIRPEWSSGLFIMLHHVPSDGRKDARTSQEMFAQPRIAANRRDGRDILSRDCLSAGTNLGGVAASVEPSAAPPAASAAPPPGGTLTLTLTTRSGVELPLCLRLPTSVSWRWPKAPPKRLGY